MQQRELKMVTRQPGKWMAKGWGFSCEITWPFWPFSLAAIPNSQETPAYNSVKASKGGGERKSGKEASSRCQVVSFSAVTLCLLARPAVVRGGNSCELKQSVLVNHAAQCDVILSLVKHWCWY